MTDQPDLLPPELLERCIAAIVTAGRSEGERDDPIEEWERVLADASARAVAPMLIAHGRELEKAEVVVWLHRDALGLAAAQATCNPYSHDWLTIREQIKKASEYANLIEAGEHRSKP